MKAERFLKRAATLVCVFLLTATASFSVVRFLRSRGEAAANNAHITTTQTNYVDKLSEKLKDEGIKKDFLEWVDKNYSGSLEKLSSLLDEKKYDKKFWHEATGNSYVVLTDLYNKKYDDADNVKNLDETSKNAGTKKLSFVGDVSLAENQAIMPAYDKRGGISGVLDDNLLKIMEESDLMAANSEFSVSNRGEALDGKVYTFRAKPDRLKIYDEMNVNLVTLANNHVYDYGKTAFLDTLDAFEKRGLAHIGAGRNLDEAKKPYYFIINGYKVAFISATQAEKNIFTPEATANDPGVFWCYNDTDIVNEVKDLRDETDYIIPIIHFGREDSHELEDAQVKTAKDLIDAGADLIVGHHAHVLQGIEFYKNKPIIYNLGSFLSNEKEVETAIFQVKLEKDGSMEYYFFPALQKDKKTTLLDSTEKQQVIDDLNSWSVNAFIDKNGKVTEDKK